MLSEMTRAGALNSRAEKHPCGQRWQLQKHLMMPQLALMLHSWYLLYL